MRENPILKHIQIIVLTFLAVVMGLAIFKPDEDKISASLITPHVTPLVKINPVNTPSLSQIKHVFVIFEENHNWSDIYKNEDAPYINNTLMAFGAYANNYHNVSPVLGGLHPSQPNYIMATAGRIAFPDHVFKSNNLPNSENFTASHDHIVNLLTKNNLSWKSYQEDISGNDCPIDKIANYSPKHNPFVYFQDISGNPPSSTNTYCQSHIRPLTELENDLKNGKVANYSFISPNLQNNMHDGSIKQADDWLSKIVPMIAESKDYKDNGAIFITWDEGAGDGDENNPIGMIIMSPFIKQGYSNSTEYTHASLLKTVQEIFNLSPLLGYAADSNTKSLSDFFETK